MYHEQKERQKAKLDCDTIESYNIKINTRVFCGKAEYADLERISELSQRANRFNLSGRRYNIEELAACFNDPDYLMYMLKAKDIYGDMGLVAAAIVKRNIIENFMLSCRVIGRGFEDKLIEYIKKDLHNIFSESEEPVGIYKKTDKNGVGHDFYSRNGINVICDDS